jgi:hypothetical protein
MPSSPEGWASMVSVRCWTCWKGRFLDNQPWSRGLEGANRTWSFSRIAAVPMMPEASKVSIEWSRCYCRTSANMSSGVRCGIAYVKRLETGAVLIEGLVVVLDELLWYRDQPRFATGSAPQTEMPAVHGAQRLARYVLPTSSKASHSQSRRTRPKRGRYNIHILMVWGCCSTGETVKRWCLGRWRVRGGEQAGVLVGSWALFGRCQGQSCLGGFRCASLVGQRQGARSDAPPAALPDSFSSLSFSRPSHTTHRTTGHRHVAFYATHQTWSFEVCAHPTRCSNGMYISLTFSIAL